MKKVIITSFALVIMLSVGTERAAALSCLPVDMYLEEVVGDEEVVIFEATSLERIEENAHTIEVLKVTEAKQGWVEKELFAYHEKNEFWGYLCNNGPKAEGSTGLYIATRNDQGQYLVRQRLELTDPLVADLVADLETASIEGGISEISTEDRRYQIVSNIKDLIAQIHALLKEYSYWKSK